MEEFSYKIENIKLLREYFALQFNDISENLTSPETQKILKKKKYNKALSQVSLSLKILRENIVKINNLFEKLSNDIKVDESKKNSTKKVSEKIKNLIRLELITNLFATEFIYLVKKLESDVKSKKKLPSELKNEKEKMKFNLQMIDNYIVKIQETIQSIQDEQNLKKKAKAI